MFDDDDIDNDIDDDDDDYGEAQPAKGQPGPSDNGDDIVLILKFDKYYQLQIYNNNDIGDFPSTGLILPKGQDTSAVA